MNPGSFRPDAPKTDPIPSLESLDISLPNLDIQENRKLIGPEHTKVVFNGITLNLQITKTIEHSENLSGLRVFISVAKEKKEDIATITINTDKSPRDKDFHASVVVSNQDREIGQLGRALWLTALKVIQKIANESGIPVKHVVIKNNKNGLSGAKWDELFFPLLGKNNYTRILNADPDMWEKTYLPQKSN